MDKTFIFTVKRKLEFNKGLSKTDGLTEEELKKIQDEIGKKGKIHHSTERFHINGDELFITIVASIPGERPHIGF